MTKLRAKAGAFCRAHTPERVQSIFRKIRSRCAAVQRVRLRNQQEDRVLNALLAWLFPPFIVCLAELNQHVQLSSFLTFCQNRPSVLLFDVLMAYLLYTILILLTNRIWLAAAAEGLTYMIFSVVELFKYSTNGNHFKLTDLTLAPNVKNLTSFAYIKITVPLVMYVTIFFLVLAVIFYQNPAFTKPWRKRMIPAAGCMIAYFGIFCVPGISQTVYGLFDVDTSAAENAFSTNEKFSNNSMLAFLLETTTEKLGNLLREPEDYTEEAVSGALTAEEIPASGDVQPNVLVIMSESFADFRRLNGLNLQTDAYDAFDAVAAESRVLNVAVPTFASYTVRTEFELIYGLPVRSLMDSITPQKEITVEYPSSMVSYYNALGYETAYVHPFVRTFYDRDSIYARYGFDRMLFMEDLTVPVQEYGNGYISDETLTDQLIELVKTTDAPLYIHTTTMQNHQPYSWIEGRTELEVYLEGVRASGAALRRLTQALAESGEPTVLLFIGDHFPSMRAEGNIYNELGINSSNCAVLYEQPALIWSNYALNDAELPQETVSAFYLSPLILKLTGQPVDRFYGTVLGQMQSNPVYTTIFLEPEERSRTLDLLTYDRITGENYSGTRPVPQQEEASFFSFFNSEE